MKPTFETGLVALLLATLAAACDDPLPAPTAPLGSRVELASGEVLLDGEGAGRRLIAGEMLEEGARLTVGEGGRALLRMSDGSGVLIREGSKVSLDEDGLGVLEGEIWAEAPDSDETLARFEAPKAVVTASGAGFNLSVDGGATSLYVARGLVVMTTESGRVEVGAGERCVAAGDGPLEVEPVAFFEDWTGGMADRSTSSRTVTDGRGRVFGIDVTSPGSSPLDLQISSQRVSAQIEDGVARTTVDQRFFNPLAVPLEGWYWFTVPKDASVERFAIEVDGALVEGRMTERKTAAAAYQEAVRMALEPAILEWIDERTFRARIYPIPAAGERRVLLSYTQILPAVDGTRRYVYPMGSDDDTPIQELSLEVDLGDEGERMALSTLEDARIEEGGRRVTMRRSGYVPRSDFLLEMKLDEELAPLRIQRFSPDGEEADYVLLRYSPNVEWKSAAKAAGDVVVIVDTSGGGDDGDRRTGVEVAEAVLMALSGEDRFALIAADLTARLIYPAQGLAPAGEKEVREALERLAEIRSSGATDLGSMFAPALDLVHGSTQPAVVYIGDGRSTVGEIANADLAERLSRSMAGSKARLFTVAVGDDADVPLLDRLAQVGGGRMLRVDAPSAAVREALNLVGAAKTPTITDLVVDAGAGLDQAFLASQGKISQGEEVILLARTHHALPPKIAVRGRLAGEAFERVYDAEVDEGDEHAYISSLWARMYLRKMMGDGAEESRGAIIALGLKHSLMTPFTSFLVLDDGSRANGPGGDRVRHRGEEGQMGRRDAAKVDSRYAIKGPADNPDPHMARAPGLAGDQETASGAMLDENTTGLLGSLGTIGHGGGGGTGSGYGRAAASLGGRSASSPQVRSGAAIVKGTLSKEVIRRIVHRHINEVKYCYERDLTQRSDLSGKVVVKFVISQTGTVQGAAIAESTLASASTEKCLVKAVERWIFPQPEGGGMVIVSHPFLFQPGDEPSAIARDREPMPEPEPEPLAAPTQPVAQIATGNPYETAARSPFVKTACSDASTRPLSQKLILWGRRMGAASDGFDLARIFEEAGARCELETWRDRKAMLDLIEARLKTATDVSNLIDALRAYPSFVQYLRRRILKRSLDPELAAGAYFMGAVDWNAIRRGLAAHKTDEARIASVRKALEGRPDDPVGRTLLLETLAQAEIDDEAMAVARRLQRDGAAGPTAMRILCELEAAAGMEEEAMRSCSELVESNPGDPEARRQLGDLFLRHGWYEAAYRQLDTLVLGDRPDPIALLRLAAAAAGMGKTDEALRLERKVASGEGEAGPDDPRTWARFLSASRLCAMILDAKAKGENDKAAALERELKRTQVASDPASLRILIWEDTQASLGLVATSGGAEAAVTNRLLAPAVGMAMIDLGASVPADLALFVEKMEGAPRRTIAFTLYELDWDKKTFSIRTVKGELSSTDAKVAVP